jgi:hypothetical protein
MLTVKQESFAQLVASGMGITSAYRQAYDNQGRDTTIMPRASRMAHSDNVKARIEALREEAADDCSWTRDRYVLALWERSQSAHKAGQYSASIKALELIARACGIGGADRVEHTGMVGVEVLARLTMSQLESLALAQAPPPVIEISSGPPIPKVPSDRGVSSV